MKETEWHSPKAESNKRKHKKHGVGLTFEEAEEVFLDPCAVEDFNDANSTIEESRFKVIGRIKRQAVVVVVYTPRDGKSRIISARYATLTERQEYYDSF